MEMKVYKHKVFIFVIDANPFSAAAPLHGSSFDYLKRSRAKGIMKKAF